MKVAGSTLASLPVLPAVAQLGKPTTMAAAPRTYTAGRFALELDGKFVGWLDSVEGGDAVGEVVVQKVAGVPIQKKHIANVKYEDFTITCGLAAGKELFQWISDTMAGKLGRKNGSIIAADYNYKAIETVEFYNALITEIAFPALDASSKEPAKMTIKFAPEHTRRTKGGSTLPPAGLGVKQKAWLCSNFKLDIAGLDCTRVSKIEALVVKQVVQADAVGVTRDPIKVPAHLEFPNLVFATSEDRADDLVAWYTDFIVNGKPLEANEKSGSLTFESPDLKAALLTINFRNLGVFKCAPEKMEAGAEGIRRIKAEMYCEQMMLVPAV